MTPTLRATERPSSVEETRSAQTERIFGTGEMAERTREHAWDQTALGPVAQWPDALVILVNALLANRHPMILFWGEELTQFYNDAAMLLLGAEKQSRGLGQAASLCWAEIWPQIEPQVRAALEGQTCSREDLFAAQVPEVPMEDAWLTCSYGPVRDAGGTIRGVLINTLETTSRVRGDQMLRDEVASRRAFEQGLAEQRERFSFATTAAQIGYWFCDLPFDKLVWDPCVKEHFWLPEDAEVDIALFYRQLHPDDREPTRQAIEASIVHHTRYDVEYRTVSPEGELRWVRAIGRTAYAADGSPTRFDGVTQDITLLKRASAALRESEDQLTTFADAMPTLAWMADAEGWIFWYNQRWYEYTGTQPEQMEGWGWQAVHDPVMLPSVMERWSASIRTGQFFEMEFPLRAADGSFRSFLTRVAPVRNESGAIVRWFGTNTDVEELRRTREDLDAERRRLTAVFDNAPIGLVFADAAGRIVNGNRQAERILRHPILYSPDVASYREWIAFHPDGRRVEGHEYPLARALADGEVHRGEFLYQCGDGAKIWVEFTGAPIRDPAGAVIGGVVATMDIDARKRAEEALMRSEKLALVGRLAATISHEINNPLEAVTNLLYLVHEGVSDPTLREFTRTAQDELGRVSQIVTHTLQFNRQTQEASLERLSDLLESALAIYEARIRSSGVTVHRQYSAEDRLCCFASELRQVFANLIGNAFDATKRGGTLSLRTYRQSDRCTGRPGVRVTVADTGSGMDKKTQQHLFEAFYTTKGDHGTGLGLWVSREILQKHQATVKVRSRQDAGRSGTVFSVWFPSEAF